MTLKDILSMTDKETEIYITSEGGDFIYEGMLKDMLYIEYKQIKKRRISWISVRDGLVPGKKVFPSLYIMIY